MKGRYGSWAVVTGASAGIGRATAEALAASAVNVVLVARRADRLAELAARLTATHGVQAVPVPLDLSAPGAIEQLLAVVAERDAGLVVHAAGFGLAGLHAEIPLEQHLALVDLNVRTVVELTRGLVPRFQARGRGGIVLFGSVIGFAGVPWTAAYAASKAFVMHLGEALQVECAGTGVEVTVVCPGPTQSEFGERAAMDLRGGASPQDVGRAVVRSLGKPGLVLTDWPARRIRGATWFAPRPLKVRIIGSVVKGMNAAHATTRSQ